MMEDAITAFRCVYAFLSHFAHSPIVWEEQPYPTVEHLPIRQNSGSGGPASHCHRSNAGCSQAVMASRAAAHGLVYWTLIPDKIVRRATC